MKHTLVFMIMFIIGCYCADKVNVWLGVAFLAASVCVAMDDMGLGTR